MTLSNYQITFNGLTIGAGSQYQILSIDGLGGTSPLRIQDENRGYIDGSYTGRDFYDERTVSIDMLVLGDNSHSAQYYYQLLQSAFAPQPLGYYVDPTGNTPASNQLQLFTYRLTNDTGDKRLYGRSRGLTTPINPDFTYGYIRTRVDVIFPDPRYYDDAGTTKTGTSFTVGNTGWATSCPVITIASCNASGNITDGTTTMYFANLTSGHNLTVDLLQRVIYYDGYAARNLMTSASTGWLAIAPNTSSVTWTSTVGSMSSTYRNAYV
jgi:hypothetical protein